MTDTVTKCAHPACACIPPKDEKFCSTYCKDAGSDEIEISCDCGHTGCGLS